MTNPTFGDIQDDIGIAYITIVGTTSSIVSNLITRAQKDCKRITGTTSGDTQDQVVRYLSDAYSIQNAMSSLDPSKANTMYSGMRDDFMLQADKSLRSIGKSLDGFKIQFTQVNP